MCFVCWRSATATSRLPHELSASHSLSPSLPLRRFARRLWPSCLLPARSFRLASAPCATTEFLVNLLRLLACHRCRKRAPSASILGAGVTLLSRSRLAPRVSLSDLAQLDAPRVYPRVSQLSQLTGIKFALSGILEETSLVGTWISASKDRSQARERGAAR